MTQFDCLPKVSPDSPKISRIYWAHIYTDKTVLCDLNKIFGDIGIHPANVFTTLAFKHFTKHGCKVCQRVAYA